MKASVKLREGDRPLLRAKLPLSLVGAPIATGIALGSSRELALHLGTLFEAGPSCRLVYRPNSDESQLSLLIKTGFGVWGSPADAPFTMAAEFKLSSKGTPSFAVQVKPQLGNFSLRKNVLSSSTITELKQDLFKACERDHGEGYENGSILVSGSVIEVPRTPEKIRSDPACNEFKVSSPPSSEGSSIVMVEDVDDHEPHQDRVKSPSPPPIEQVPENDPINLHVNTEDRAPAIKRVQNGNWGLIAHTALPLGRHAVATVRWRVKLEPEILKNFQNDPGLFSLQNLPVLVVDKLSFKCVEDSNRHRPAALSVPFDNDEALAMAGLTKEPLYPELEKVASLCSSMKRELHFLRAENEILRKTMEDMKFELGSGKRRGSRAPSYMVMDKEMQREFFGNGHGRKDAHRYPRRDQHRQQEKNSAKSRKPGKDREVEVAKSLEKHLGFELRSSKEDEGTAVKK